MASKALVKRGKGSKGGNGRRRRAAGPGSRATPKDSVQSELDGLQRKYRELEMGRKNLTEDSQNTIRMQRQQIEKLKKDNERLKEDLALETRQAKHTSNMSASAQIAKLQDQGDVYRRKIETEQSKIKDLDRRIADMRAKILKQREDMGGYNASREKNMKISKDIRIKENQLDKALVKYNAALAHNKQLRDTIDNLRRERVVFDGIYGKLADELRDKKKQMADIIEQSNRAYVLRDAAQQEMIQLKMQADEEQKAFEEKWRSLGSLIEKDRRMKDFVKGKGGSNQKLIAGGGGGGGAGAATGSGGDVQATDEKLDPAEEEERKLQKRVESDTAEIEKNKNEIELAKQKVDSYETRFAQIAKATGISNIDDLVTTFTEAEDHNFQLFNHVNDLSNEIEKLEENIAALKKEIQKYKGQGASTDNQRKRLLRDLEDQLTSTESKAKFYEQKHSEALATVEALKEGIGNVFKKIGCTDPTEILGNAGVTESNMMQYLGLIEQRTNELLMEYEEQRQADAEEKTQPPAADQSQTPALKAPELPTVTLDDEDNDDADADVEPVAIPDMNKH